MPATSSTITPPASLRSERARLQLGIVSGFISESLSDFIGIPKYFDATAQAEYLYECVAETIEKDLREEIGFIQKYDRALDETKEIVDMPDKRASLLVRLIMQNKGRLTKNKRDMFSEVTDEELARIEKAIATAVE